MKKTILLLLTVLSLTLFTGCGIIPKPVEFFQKKVQKFPAFSPAQTEAQREAAALAQARAQQALDAILSEGSSTNVVVPARDTVKLTQAVSTSLGPPVKPTTNVTAVVKKVETGVAKHDVAVEKFAAKNDTVAGKKIEGTGKIQVPYLVYVGVIALVLVIFWHLAKTALTVASVANPGAAVAVGGMSVASSVASKAVSQLVQGGEDFKSWVEKEIADTGLKQKILDAFTSSHKQAQDGDVQAVVKPLTK